MGSNERVPLSCLGYSSVLSNNNFPLFHWFDRMTAGLAFGQHLKKYGLNSGAVLRVGLDYPCGYPA